MIIMVVEYFKTVKNTPFFIPLGDSVKIISSRIRFDGFLIILSENIRKHFIRTEFRLSCFVAWTLSISI